VEQNVAIEPVTARDLPEVRDDLAELLRDIVNGGGTVGFLPPLSADEAATYWREVGEALEGGGRRLLVARQGGWSARPSSTWRRRRTGGTGPRS
jgi:acetyltransferase